MPAPICLHLARIVYVGDMSTELMGTQGRECFFPVTPAVRLADAHIMNQQLVDCFDLLPLADPDSPHVFGLCVTGVMSNTHYSEPHSPGHAFHPLVTSLTPVTC